MELKNLLKQTKEELQFIVNNNEFEIIEVEYPSKEESPIRFKCQADDVKFTVTYNKGIVNPLFLCGIYLSDHLSFFPDTNLATKFQDRLNEDIQVQIDKKSEEIEELKALLTNLK